METKRIHSALRLGSRSEERLRTHSGSKASVGDVDDSLERGLEERKRESRVSFAFSTLTEAKRSRKRGAHNMEGVLDELRISHQVLDLRSTEELEKGKEEEEVSLRRQRERGRIQFDEP